MAPIPPFRTILAVPLNCETCIRDVETSLYKVPGVENVEADLARQLISINGTAAPSSIVSAIQSTGRDAILRGTGQENSAAVCILETHSDVAKNKSPVRGLVRMVQLMPNMTLVDVAVKGVSEGEYSISLRASGDISAGPERTGNLFDGDAQRPRGLFGSLAIGKSGSGSALIQQPIAVWEMIGRSMVVSSAKVEGPFSRCDPDTLVGVVARSAGVWDNDKTVCSCSGKTVWQERREQVDRGMP